MISNIRSRSHGRNVLRDASRSSPGSGERGACSHAVDSSNACSRRRMRVSHAPRGLTVCPGMASGVAGRHTKGEAPGALAPSPVTGSACRDLSRQAPDPPISLRRQCACGSFHRANREGSHTPSPRRRDLLAGALSRPPHPTATPASAPDILSSDAFQDLPSSGADAVYVRLGRRKIWRGLSSICDA